MRREGVALALELQHEAECTFSPNLHKPGVRSAAPPEAKLSLSAEVRRRGGVGCYVGRGGREGGGIMLVVTASLRGVNGLYNSPQPHRC